MDPGAEPWVAIDSIFETVSNVLTSVPHVFSPVSPVLASVTDPTLKAPVQDILTAVPNVFSAIPHVFATVPPVLSLIPSQRRPVRRTTVRGLALANLPHQYRRAQGYQQASPQNRSLGTPHIDDSFHRLIVVLTLARFHFEMPSGRSNRNTLQH